MREFLGGLAAGGFQVGGRYCSAAGAGVNVWRLGLCALAKGSEGLGYEGFEWVDGSGGGWWWGEGGEKMGEGGRGGGGGVVGDGDGGERGGAGDYGGPKCAGGVGGTFVVAVEVLGKVYGAAAGDGWKG